MARKSLTLTLLNLLLTELSKAYSARQKGTFLMNNTLSNDKVKTITKADIISRVHDELKDMMNKKEAAELVGQILETIKETLKEDEQLKISGFGNFVVRQKEERMGRNPQTGERITISARKVLTFKASQVLKREINAAG